MTMAGVGPDLPCGVNTYPTNIVRPSPLMKVTRSGNVLSARASEQQVSTSAAALQQAAASEPLPIASSPTRRFNEPTVFTLSTTRLTLDIFRCRHRNCGLGSVTSGLCLLQ